MRRFLAAWDAFKQRWKGWVEELDYTCIISTARPLTDRQKKDLQAIIDGLAHARRYPAKKGDRGFRMEGGRG